MVNLNSGAAAGAAGVGVGGRAGILRNKVNDKLVGKNRGWAGTAGMDGILLKMNDKLVVNTVELGLGPSLPAP